MNETESKSRAQLILILGLLGVVSCYPLGPIAYVMGGAYLRECEDLGIVPDSMGNTGRILGLIATGLLLITVLFVVLYFALVAVLVVAGP